MNYNSNNLKFGVSLIVAFMNRMKFVLEKNGNCCKFLNIMATISNFGLCL